MERDLYNGLLLLCKNLFCNCYAQSIVCWSDVGWQLFEQLVVVQLVGHMSQVSLARLQLTNKIQSGIEMQMRWVRLVAQSIQHQHIQISQLLSTVSRDCGNVRTKRHVPNAKPQDRQFSMLQPDRTNIETKQRKILPLSDSFEP